MNDPWIFVALISQKRLRLKEKSQPHFLDVDWIEATCCETLDVTEKNVWLIFAFLKFQ